MRAFVAASLLTAVATFPLIAQAGPLQNVRWLEGCWQMVRGSTTTTERWMAPANDAMVGDSRTLANGAERESERLRLFAVGDTLVYESTPSSQTMARFRTTTTTGNEITFANPEHDFPQRIVYRRVGADSLIARIEGDRAGRRQPVTFPYKKVPCSATDDAIFRANGAFFAISVPNADTSRAWYVEKFGMREIFRSPAQNGARVIVVSGGGLTVEILENVAAVPLRTAAPAITHTTLVHGTFKAGLFVDDFEGTIRRLRDRGVVPAMGPFPASNGVPANAILRDNYGNFIQFFGR